MDVYDDDVIRNLTSNKENVRRLVKHARNKCIVNTKGAYYYVDTNGKYQLLSGLLPRLRRTFFPDINIFNVLKKPSSSSKNNVLIKKTSRTRGQKASKKAKVLGSKGWHYGKIRGTTVHQEIEDFIFLDSKAFIKKHETIHPYTQKILTFILETMGWRLLRAEFDIYDEALRIGTSIDIVAVKTNGQLVLIEVKCGFSEYFDHDDGYMHGALHKLTNSPHHQANVQLITEALLVVRHHEIPLDQLLLYVIRVDDHGLYHYHINNEYVRKKGAKIYNELRVDELNSKRSTLPTRKSNGRTDHNRSGRR